MSKAYRKEILDRLQRKELRVVTKTNYTEGFNEAILIARSIVSKVLPKDIELEPVVHGHWIADKFYNRYKCSLCGWVEDIDTTYCPECGAKMSEKVKVDENLD